MTYISGPRRTSAGLPLREIAATRPLGFILIVVAFVRVGASGCSFAKPEAITAMAWSKGTAAAKKRALGSAEKKGQHNINSGPEPQWISLRESLESTLPDVARVVHNFNQTAEAIPTNVAPLRSWRRLEGRACEQVGKGLQAA